MRKESLFTAEHVLAKRVYQSPAMRLVKLEVTTILAGSNKSAQTNEEYGNGGSIDSNF